MGEAAKRLLGELMALSEQERELVAVELYASLSTHEPGWEEAWSQEIERRVEEVRSGSVTLRTWDEVRAELRAHRTAR